MFQTVSLLKHHVISVTMTMILQNDVPLFRTPFFVHKDKQKHSLKPDFFQPYQNSHDIRGKYA